MNAFNRAFVGLLALGWVAALGAAVWLVWDQARVVDITSESVNLNFDIIANTQAEQILATIVAGTLMLPALMLLMFEMKPSRRRETAVQTADEGDVRKMQDRIDSLEKDLSEERGRNESLRRDRTDDGTSRPHTGRRWGLFSRN